MKSDIKVEALTIGSKVFVVNRDYAFKRKAGGKVLPARVVAFENRNNNIEIVMKITGRRDEVTVVNYVPFINIQKAIDAIKS